MAIYSQKRLILSLRQPFQSYHKFISSISRLSSHSSSPLHSLKPNFRSSPLSSTSRFLTSFGFPPSIHNRSFRSNINGGSRSFATRLSDSSSSNNRPPKETMMLEGCDYEHWLVVVEPPDPQLTRDEIIDGYIKTLAHVIGSEEEARMKIYSVSTRHYFAFSALMSEELGYKLKDLPNVRWVLPDSYMDVKNKTYAGEPFINGQPVPYDPKYHEIWVRNHEESLRNMNKNRTRQRDPNLRPRSPPSSPARGNSNQNWLSVPSPQNQDLQTSIRENQTSQRQQDWVPPADSPNETVQSSKIQIPSNMQNQAPPVYSQNQAPPVYSQNQAPHAYSQNQAPPAYSQNQAPLAYSQNQAALAYSQNPAPPTYSQNLAPPSYLQNRPPQPSHKQNNLKPWASPPPPLPPSQPSATRDPNPQSWGSQSHSWEPPMGSGTEARYSSHLQNQTPPPSSTSNPYDPGRTVNSPHWETATKYQTQPPQSPNPNDNFSYNNTTPSAPGSNVPYRGHNWGPASAHQSWSQQPPNSNNFSYDIVPPSSPGRGLPSHMQNPNFYGGRMQPQVQQNEYTSWDIPPHAQSGGSSNGYPSQSLQQQQYLDSHNTYRDVQSSKSVITHRSAQNFHNATVVPPSPARDMPSHMWDRDSAKLDKPAEVQQNGYYISFPHHGHNGRAHTGYPPHTSQYQQYQNSSRDLQSSNPTESPQSWNYQNMTPSMPISHAVQTHQFQGKDMPRPMQNSECEHNVRPSAQNFDYNGGRMPNDMSMETEHIRDYQERDIPGDDYMYASK
ncbi:hypothetical protein BVRB_7g171870 [Beta vulgaris subsp. vulgaris]|nr:hypothetical protein BVRB_7g171870 [Beta vulgaris subsp. vulgaris]